MTVLMEIQSVSKQYGLGAERVYAIGEITFSVEQGEFVSVVGPSGCGKTTLLKCVAGLLKPSSGQTRLAAQVVTAPPADLAVVFQDYSNSLFPWLSVRKNVLLPIKKKRDVRDKRAAVRDALDAVGLSEFTEHFPWQLSGGMQQRVAIARALAYQPKVLLMDEPFASVDAQTRGELEDLVLTVHDRYGITIVLVTHDIDEATYMADQVVVLSSRPSRVRETIAIDLPRPRDQIATKELAAFGHLRTAVYRSVVLSKTSDDQGESTITDSAEAMHGLK